MLKKFVLTVSLMSIFVVDVILAADNMMMPTLVYEAPKVQNVTSSSANFIVPSNVINTISTEDESATYFEYYETNQVCIMIYPTPESCLPKSTKKGLLDITVNNLKPATSYTVSYKKDNSIRCVKAPCLENNFQSYSTEFTTKSSATTSTSIDNIQITKNLWLGSRGPQVVTLQTVLISQGYMHGNPTGYFGRVTFKAVKLFQESHNINPTGFVGRLTREALKKMTVVDPRPNDVAERFEGTVTAYSTSCFSDGECSVTVDGKKIITTIGRSQMIVGTVIGIPNFGSIEKHIGSRAEVYVKKTDGIYTLYGSTNYYIKIF